MAPNQPSQSSGRSYSSRESLKYWGGSRVILWNVEWKDNGRLCACVYSSNLGRSFHACPPSGLISLWHFHSLAGGISHYWLSLNSVVGVNFRLKLYIITLERTKSSTQITYACWLLDVHLLLAKIIAPSIEIRNR